MKSHARAYIPGRPFSVLEQSAWGIIQLMNDVLKRAELIKDESTLCVHREKN